jgi:hypothetical protein
MSRWLGGRLGYFTILVQFLEDMLLQILQSAIRGAARDYSL